LDQLFPHHSTRWVGGVSTRVDHVETDGRFRSLFPQQGCETYPIVDLAQVAEKVEDVLVDPRAPVGVLARKEMGVYGNVEGFLCRFLHSGLIISHCVPPTNSRFGGESIGDVGPG